jgi:hypothetical protein
MYNADRLGGMAVLAAMAVPAADFDRLAALVNAHPEVAHNYARDHRLNMWFVVSAEHPEIVEQTLRAIEAETGLPVLAMPKLSEYRIGLRLVA